MNVSLLAVVNLNWMPNATSQVEEERDVPVLVGSVHACLSLSLPPSL